MRSLTLLLGAAFLVGCGLPEVDGGDSSSGAGGGNGQLPGAEVDALVSELPEDSAGPRVPTLGCTPFEFTIAPNATHKRASASFALAALRGGSWPDINRSLLDHTEFLSHFARSFDQAGSYARLRTTADGAVLDLFVEPPASADPRPTHLIVVVDVSSSMRDDLETAGAVTMEIGNHLTELGEDGDQLSIVLLNDAGELFFSPEGGHTVGREAAAEHAGAFRQHAAELASAQLPPGSSLGPAKVLIEKVLAERTSTAPPSVVIVTDGGLKADDGAVGFLESFREGGIPVAFVEVAGAGEGTAPRTFHRDQLERLGELGDGLTFFATLESAAEVVADFDGNFRVAQSSITPRYSVSGIDGLLEEIVTSTTDAGAPVTLRSSWAAVGRHLYSAVPVSTSSCGEGVVSGVVDVTGTGAGEELATDATQDKRLERLALVDEIYLLLAGDCAAAADRLAVGSPLTLMPSGNEDLVEIVTLVADKCELGL